MNAPTPLPPERSLRVVEPEPELDTDCDVEFDWEKHAEDICVASQDAIAVYPNCRGQVVIRQQGGVCDDGDHFIFVRHTDALALTEAILREAEAAAEAAGHTPPTVPPKRESGKRQPDLLG